MDEKGKMEAVQTEQKKAQQEESLYVKFKKPFLWEDNTYDGIDLSGLENLSTMDMIMTERSFAASGRIPILSEMSLEYACLFAAKATEMPVEFFQALPPKEGIKVKNMVSNFFYGEE